LLTFPNGLTTSRQAFLTRGALTEIARTSVANISALAGSPAFVNGSVVT
jgi:D-lactate dehydrogenase